MVLVLSSLGWAGGIVGMDGPDGGCCNGMVLVFRPDKMLEMSVGPRISGRLDTVIGSLGPMLRAAVKSGRLGGAAVLLPDRNGVPASELGSRTLVGTGGGGGL